MKTRTSTIRGLVLAGVTAALILLSIASNAGAATFGRDGKLTMYVRGDGIASRVMSDGHGGLLMFSSRYVSNPSLVRLKADGSVDKKFGNGGYVAITAAPQALIVGGGGKIVVIGSVDQLAGTILVSRLLPDGRPDRSFGKRGTASVALGQRYNEGTALAFGRHGKIWFGGAAIGPEEGRGGGNAESVLGRLTSKGKLDTSFSHNGLTRLFGSGHVEALAAEPDGGVLAMDGGALVRVKGRGGFDRSFGQGGLMTPTLPAPPENRYFAPAPRIGMLGGGRFLLLGTTEGPAPAGYSGMAVRYKADGAVDRGYGERGLAPFGFRSTPFTFPASFVVGGGGAAYVAAAYIDSEGAHRFGAIKLRPNGTIDRSFGQEGQLTARFAGYSTAQDIAFKPNKRIVLLGYSQYEGQNSTALAQLSLNGQPVR